MFYEIVISGYIQETWFDELTVIKQPDLTTMLRGNLVDQSALYGVLRKINDLVVDLISVNRMDKESEPKEVSANKST